MFRVYPHCLYLHFLVYNNIFRSFRKQTLLCSTAARMPILIWYTTTGWILQKFSSACGLYASWVQYTDDVSRSKMDLYWRRSLTYNCPFCCKYICGKKSRKSLQGNIALQWKEFGGLGSVYVLHFQMLDNVAVHRTWKMECQTYLFKFS